MRSSRRSTRVAPSCLTARARRAVADPAGGARGRASPTGSRDHGVDAAIAGPLADTAVTIEALDRFAAVVSGPPLARVLRWTAAPAARCGRSPRRFRRRRRGSPAWSAAIKGFTHMDQATVAEPVDLGSSLGNTVAVLKREGAAKSAAVTVNVPADLPRVRGLRRRAQPDLGEPDRQRARCRPRLRPRRGERHPRAAARRRARRRQRAGHSRRDPQRIFDPFFTTKPVGKGTGLGLDIVRRLVSHNDAEIEVDSQPGRTEFGSSLPIADAPGAGAPGVNKPVLLVVDDDPQVLAAVRRDLRSRYREDYTVISASSGEEALTTIRELKARGDALAMVISDQRMPGHAGDRGARAVARDLSAGAARAAHGLLGHRRGHQGDQRRAPRSLPVEAVGSAGGMPVPGRRRSARRWQAEYLPEERDCGWSDTSGRRDRTRSRTSSPATSFPIAGSTSSATPDAQGLLDAAGSARRASGAVLRGRIRAAQPRAA